MYLFDKKSKKRKLYLKEDSFNAEKSPFKKILKSEAK